MRNDIVITGEGIVCAIGLDKQQVLNSLREKRTGIGEIKYLNSIHHDLPVGEVPLSNDEMKKQLGLEEKKYVNRTTLMGMLAIRQALKDSGIDSNSVKERALRVVLISGTTVAGMDITEQFFKDLQTSDDHLLCMKYHSAGSSTRLLADYFNLFTEYTTLSTACSSAANAVILGANLLKDGQADIVIAGGSEALSLFHLNGFNSLMILDHNPCRPFDEKREGLNLGEGAAYLVLEKECSALQRHAEIHGYLRGYGNACDAFHQTASSENGEGAFLAMTEALQMARLRPDEIQYVNAHGTGTPNNDQSESAALKRVFGSHMPFISSTKSFTGHTTSASGSIELVISLLALRHQFIPANLCWTQQMTDGITPTTGVDHCSIHHVLCNSFGFGGNDSSLLVSSHGAPPSIGEASSTKGHSIQVVSKVEITSEEQLAEIRDYVKPMETRRMGKIMKSSLLSSLKALKAAGIEKPDAIITGTSMGCLENSEQLLLQLIEEGEGSMKPTYFMQSTHNTISSNIAIRLGCHGYNVTYTQDDDSLKWALRDAEMLLRSGKYKTVLVGCHDETTHLFSSIMQRLGESQQPSIHSIAMILTCGE